MIPESLRDRIDRDPRIAGKAMAYRLDRAHIQAALAGLMEDAMRHALLHTETERLKAILNAERKR